MKNSAVCLLVGIVAAVVLVAEGGPATPSAKEIDEMMKNDRAIKNAINCFLDKGACSPELKEMKEKIPAMVETSCAECSKDQTAIIKKGMQMMMKNHPEDWKALMAKYDPEGKFAPNLDKFMESA